MVDEAALHTAKTMIHNLLGLFPLRLLPDVNPSSVEAQLFDRAMKTVMHNAEVNGVEPENFLDFCEAFRKTMLFLMEQDGYYRKYVKMFFDVIQQEQREQGRQ